MQTGWLMEFLVEREQAYRRAVVHPTAERRAEWARELRPPPRQERKATAPRAPVRWLRERLGHLGERPHAAAATRARPHA